MLFRSETGMNHLIVLKFQICRESLGLLKQHPSLLNASASYFFVDNEENSALQDIKHPMYHLRPPDLLPIRTITESKLGKEYIKAIHWHLAYLTYEEYIKGMPGWMTHKLESRLLGEISTISDMQMIPL